MKQQIPDFTSSPMEEQYKALVAAFDYFNRKLFNGILPRCIISFSRFYKMTSGYSIPERWHRANEQGQAVAVHEICLSPSLLLKAPIELFAKLVHEMVHIWQWDYGNPSRNGYHNKEWARKMESIGLMPSHTGEPEGKKTGQAMEQYVLDDGLFKKAFEKMPNKYLLPFVSDFNYESLEGRKARLVPKSNRGKTKYTCPQCKVNAWGKPNLAIICASCNKGSGNK